MKQLISDKIYDVVKHVAQIALPAVAAFYATIANIWGLPFGTEIPATISAVAVLLCSFLGISSALYKGGNEDAGDIE